MEKTHAIWIIWTKSATDNLKKTGNHAVKLDKK